MTHGPAILAALRAERDDLSMMLEDCGEVVGQLRADNERMSSIVLSPLPQS